MNQNEIIPSDEEVAVEAAKMSPEEKSEFLKKVMKEAEHDPYVVSTKKLKLAMILMNELNTHSAGPPKVAGPGRGRKKKETVEVDESKLLDLDSFIKEP
jgi:hypothetical protein